MANYLTTDTELESVADAIREKGGTSEQLVYPSGFVSAIEAIQTGGAGMVAPYAYQSSTITSFSSDATGVLDYAFQNCSALTTVSLPVASYIGNYAFAYCYSLSDVSLPMASYIGSYAFISCSRLTTVSLPVASYIGSHAFSYCYSLSDVSLPVASYIGSYAFSYCYNLISLYLTSTSICSLPYSNAFSSTPIGGYSASAGQYGSIYVPASLLASYQTKTNWSYFSSRFVGI